MTQEYKELLLKDICARLPYGVMVGYSGKDNPGTLDKIGRVIYVDTRFGTIQMQDGSGISYGLPPSETIKPYLRPMSSMTEEECIELDNIEATIENISEVIPNVPYYIEVASPKQIDWLNANHFDYRGLIPKGLALEVTPDNNPYKDNNQ